MKNEIEQIAQQNDMSIEFVTRRRWGAEMSGS